MLYFNKKLKKENDFRYDTIVKQITVWKKQVEVNSRPDHHQEG